MDRYFESLAREAEQLPPDERYQLAERLMQNLPPAKEHLEAWLKESRSRAEAVDRGEIDTVDAEEVFRKVRNLIRK